MTDRVGRSAQERCGKTQLRRKPWGRGHFLLLFYHLSYCFLFMAITEPGVFSDSLWFVCRSEYRTVNTIYTLTLREQWPKR